MLPLMRSVKRWEDMMDLEDWWEDSSVSFKKKWLWEREKKAGVVCDGLHDRDESLLPATLNISSSSSVV